MRKRRRVCQVEEADGSELGNTSEGRQGRASRHPADINSAEPSRKRSKRSLIDQTCESCGSSDLEGIFEGSHLCMYCAFRTGRLSSHPDLQEGDETGVVERVVESDRAARMLQMISILNKENRESSGHSFKDLRSASRYLATLPEEINGEEFNNTDFDKWIYISRNGIQATLEGGVDGFSVLDAVNIWTSRFKSGDTIDLGKLDKEVRISKLVHPKLCTLARLKSLDSLKCRKFMEALVSISKEFNDHEFADWLSDLKATLESIKTKSEEVVNTMTSYLKLVREFEEEEEEEEEGGGEGGGETPDDWKSYELSPAQDPDDCKGYELSPAQDPYDSEWRE